MRKKVNLTSEEIKKKVEEYLKKPYAIKLIPEEDGTYFVEVEELKGCFSAGDTVEEAMESIKEAMELWIETALKNGHKIPEPEALQDYSGKILIRVPKEMHRTLIRKAKAQNVSLNQLILYLLSAGLGQLNILEEAMKSQCYECLVGGFQTLEKHSFKDKKISNFFIDGELKDRKKNQKKIIINEETTTIITGEIPHEIRTAA